MEELIGEKLGRAVDFNSLVVSPACLLILAKAKHLAGVIDGVMKETTT